jgi:hypothetical protein
VAAVRELNRLELAGESVRAVLEALSASASDWISQVLDPSWSRRYAARIDTWRLPASKTKRDALALDYARDGYALLGAVYDPRSPAWLRELPAVQTLRTVLIQNYTRTVSGEREVVKRREKQEDGGDGLPPGEIRIASPYDTQARWSAKRDTFWLGYKLHISETCSRPAPDADPAAAPDRPNLITNVTTTAATLPDSKALEIVHASLGTRGLLPHEHYLDSGYPSAELIVSSFKQHGVALITPVLLDHSRQARAKDGFAAHDFTIDWVTEKATCPAGKTSATWNPVIQNGTPKTVISFAAADCGPCPFKNQCTSARSNRRQLSIHPQQMFETLCAARVEQRTEDWKADYALRAGIEGTVQQTTHRTGARRTPYQGLAKTHLDHVYCAAAINLIRLDAWWNGHSLDRTRTSHFARLGLALAA